MANKKQNFDGIKNSAARCAKLVRIKRNEPPIPASKLVMDGIRLMKRPKRGVPVSVHIAQTFNVPFRSDPVFRRGFNFSGIYRRIPQLAPLVLALILAFGGGMWYALRTPQSAAENLQPAPQVESAEVSAPIVMGNVPASSDPAVSNDMLFNTPLAMLKDYLASSAAQDQMADRKAKLHQFLKDKNSPLEPEADFIAEQEHWKLILAISFAESTLGEHCQWKNCSGIGGSQLRAYKSFDNWILDFDRLLENRYKDKTLEQMCGVYVQPCTSNWLMATKQILTALDQANIE